MGREGKGPIHLEDAPLRAPLALIVLFWYFPTRNGAAELGFKRREPCEGKEREGT